MNKEQLIEKLEETKERLDHYQAEGNTEYIDLCREEICEIEETIAELEMNKDKLKIECDNDLYKYDNADIYDYICTLREIICNDVLKEQKLKKQLDIANKKLELLQNDYDSINKYYNYSKEVIEKDKNIIDKIKEKINDYSCIYNKGFPYTLLLALRGNHPNENQYLELDKVLSEFESIIGGE